MLRKEKKNTKLKINTLGTLHNTKTFYNWDKENEEKYKEYRRQWEENPKNAVVGSAPINLDIEVSSACNLRCEMCFSTIQREKNGKTAYPLGVIPFDMYKKIIDEAVQIGVSAVKLNWRGEPLLNPNIIQMVAYAKQQGILEILMNTNAVLLDEDMSLGLIKAGLDKIIFSVDAIQKEEYEKIRVGANFEDTINNITYFSKLNQELGHSVNIRIQRVKMRDEDESIQAAYERYFEKIADTVAYMGHIPFECNVNETLKTYPKFRCEQLFQRLVISWEGKCFMCCIDTEEKYKLGNIQDSSIKDIWLSSKLNYVREKHKNNLWYQCETCRECQYAYTD